MRYTHSSLEVCDLADLEGLTRLLVAGISRDRPQVQPRSGRLPRMKHYLGIDIGTFESKGVIVDGTGEIVATAARPHKMLVPQPGWAEHRPKRIGGATSPSSRARLLADSRHRAHVDHARSAPAPSAPACCRSTRDGEPLMNAVLYGVDARAAKEIEELTAAIGADAHPRALRQCADLAVGRPEDPVAEEEPPGDFRQGAQDRDLDHLSRAEADRRMRHRPLFGGELHPALPGRRAGLEQRTRARHHRARAAARGCLDDRHRRPRHAEGGARDRAGRRHAGHRRHHRRGRGSAQRRRRCGPAT